MPESRDAFERALAISFDINNHIKGFALGALGNLEEAGAAHLAGKARRQRLREAVAHLKLCMEIFEATQNIQFKEFSGDLLRVKKVLNEV